MSERQKSPFSYLLQHHSSQIPYPISSPIPSVCFSCVKLCTLKERKEDNWMDRDSPSLPQPCPCSPPEYQDLYGRRREFAKVQMLEREIGFLQEELKSVEGFQPASRCCKEVVDFSLGNSDPLIPTYQKRSASCGFWKWLCCCYAVCPSGRNLPCRCTCDSCIHIPECRCSNYLLRKWPFSSCCYRPDCSKLNRHCRNCNCLLPCPCGGNSSCCCQLYFRCNGLCCNPCY